MDAQQLTCFRWTAHPARERPGRAVLGVAIIMGIAAAAYLSFGWEWSVASALILILSLNRFFLPSRFEIDDDRIVARYPLRIRTLHWRDVRRFVCDADGGFISTRSRRSFMDPSSGMHVLFGGDAEQRERIIKGIRARVNDGGSTLGVEQTRRGASFHQGTLRHQEMSCHPETPAVTTGGSPCRE